MNNESKNAFFFPFENRGVLSLYFTAIPAIKFFTKFEGNTCVLFFSTSIIFTGPIHIDEQTDRRTDKYVCIDFLNIIFIKTACTVKRSLGLSSGYRKYFHKMNMSPVFRRREYKNAAR